MTDHTYAGYTAEQIRAAAEAATQGKWRALGHSSNVNRPGFRGGHFV